MRGDQQPGVPEGLSIHSAPLVPMLRLTGESDLATDALFVKNRQIADSRPMNARLENFRLRGSGNLACEIDMEVTTVRARFTDLGDLGEQTPAEWETLVPLHAVCMGLWQEWESATVQTDHALTRREIAAAYTRNTRLSHHQQSFDEVYGAALAYGWQIGEITWRYASATAVLGVSVLERLVSGRPPLNDAHVQQLATREPSITQLLYAFSIPANRLFTARGKLHIEHAEESRQELRQRLEAASDLLTCEYISSKSPVKTPIADRQLTSLSKPGESPYWLDFLEPMLNFSELLPHEIAHYLNSGFPGVLNPKADPTIMGEM
ncbi:hypothetical protein [Streptomyces sp. NPDC005799]|uniref:hypothetical protein n=1 Tax=Streptomyces sp. NPDC005799 TaxID=3154678 RepID=UPI00340E3A57